MSTAPRDGTVVEYSSSLEEGFARWDDLGQKWFDVEIEPDDDGYISDCHASWWKPAHSDWQGEGE